MNLDQITTLALARVMNREDKRVADAVQRALPAIAHAIEAAAKAIRKGGRLIYVGAGTSGRIAALDAAECPPTFGTHPKTVQYVMASGAKALGVAAEGSEDSTRIGRRDMARKHPTPSDVVVGIAASGRTPYTIAALSYARRCGAATVSVTCNRGSVLEKAAKIRVVAETGAEVLSGSTRMKAGTAQKMILNMISTGAMARLGYVYGNRMVNVHVKNSKLRERGLGILEQCAKVSRQRARVALEASENSVPVALVSLLAEVKPAAARRALKAVYGHVRRAISLAQKTSN